jgi:protein tyrosine/serine phosphatase
MPAVQLERDLVWEGCLNVRDLGGHETADGTRTRHGAIVRADSVRKLSDEGWRRLVDHGIETVIDLRFEEELEADPPSDAPVNVVHIPLLGPVDETFGTELDALSRAAGTGAPGTQAVYLEFLERFPANFAAVLRAIADAPAGGVLVHCQGGKDRTGLVVALLLSLAGVPREEIAADYAVSERNLAEAQADWEASAESEDERLRRRQIGMSPPEAMLGVLEELDGRWGGARAYLLAAGATEEELDRAVARL